MDNVPKVKFKIENNGNTRLKKAISKVLLNKRLLTYWVCSNINSIDRMKLNDHGPTHMKLVAENALDILRKLKSSGMKTSIETDYMENPRIPHYCLSYNDSEVVVFLGSCLHDLGMIIHRIHHEKTGVALASEMADEILGGLYREPEKTIIKSEILHCVKTHSSEGGLRPLTVESAVIRLADAIDTCGGRSKIVHKLGKKDRHSIATEAIDQVSVKSGEEAPVIVEFSLNSRKGMFKVDILKNKLKDTLIENQVKVRPVLRQGIEKSRFDFINCVKRDILRR